MAISLRDRQIASIKRLLSLNAPVDADSAQDDSNETANPDIAWRVLVYDDAAKAVVTVHLNLKSRRSPIPAPGIYLMAPTAENLALVTKDLSEGLYTPAYVNFLTSIPRQLLESWGGELAPLPEAAGNLAQIYDHLNIDNSYYTLNSPRTKDEELDAHMDRIVSGLFSVVVTMAVIPIIRAPKGGAAEVIAAKLDRKLRDHVLNSKENLFASSTASRPVLIIIDRNADLNPMFSHSWIYQSLVYDVCKFHLNKIEVTVPNDKNKPESGTKKQSYDLAATDYFWNRNASQPFPNVAEEVTNEWTKYSEDADALTKKTGSSSLDDLSGESNQFAAHLKGAISLLPELRERKATIEAHMSILEAIMEGIKQRKLDEFFQLEEEIEKQTKSSIMEILKDPSKGEDPMDKFRFFVQWYLTTQQDVSRSELEGFDAALKSAGVDTTALAYIKTVRQITQMSMLSSAAPTQPAQSSSQLFGGFTSLSSRVTDRFKEAGLGANFEGVLSGIKSYLPANQDLTLTKITESLMDPQNATSSALNKTENYLYFDPRSANARGTAPPTSQSQKQQSTVGRGIDATFGQRRQGFSEAIVFPVGGGSMDEETNIQAWAKRTSAAAGTGPKRRIVYGSTKLYAPRAFIEEELIPLGKEST
ncbi:snare docking complex subunit [Stemphylium lycopersici]|uniref:Snare docking complex subunit n=1 Tax=Stemphylium lycopersici TaxID=183478 RepID=A0A364NGY3_STELY|nr:sec1-like protein [Stemphylium lycopersici]RAR02507.1 snare docking complex subunit [Stemphylium lycopersici]RAR16558.1 snare docking complex subunit [Stemphylium lycopersici]